MKSKIAILPLCAIFALCASSSLHDMATTERDEGRPRPSTDLESELLLQREDEGDEREQDNEHWLSKRRFSTFEKGLLAICACGL